MAIVLCVLPTERARQCRQAPWEYYCWKALLGGFDQVLKRGGFFGQESRELG